jgi:non-ribosomal peptide synthetase component E (peptide arylation enzyme)
MGGVGILSGYGSTEAPILSMSRMDDPSEKLATTEGRPALPEVELRVVGSDDLPVASGEVGEFRVRGPQLFRGYVDPGLDATAYDQDGFFRTGDLGYLDEDGYVVVTGRLKDIIIRKGENISAKEVEDLLYEHSKIAEVAVIGLPDPQSGERCCAVVTCHDPKSVIRFEEMRDFLREHQLMIQRIPEQLEIIDSMPRNATGKILKHELRKRFRR